MFASMPSSFESLTPDFSAGPEFLVIYAIIALVAVAVGRLAGSMVATALDHGFVPTTDARRGASKPAHHQRFSEGFLPHKDELLGVGYLNRGRGGIANALIGEGLGAHWLVILKDGITLAPLPKEASREASDFYAELKRRGVLSRASVGEAAEQIAQRLEPEIRGDLTRTGFLRTAFARTAARVAVLGCASVAVGFGITRALHARAAGGPYLLLLVEVAALSAAALGASEIAELSDRGVAYLAWIHDATRSLREDASHGRPLEPDDLVLASALYENDMARGITPHRFFPHPTGT